MKGGRGVFISGKRCSNQVSSPSTWSGWDTHTHHNGKRCSNNRKRFSKGRRGVVTAAICVVTSGRGVVTVGRGKVSGIRSVVTGERCSSRRKSCSNSRKRCINSGEKCSNRSKCVLQIQDISVETEDNKEKRSAKDALLLWCQMKTAG